jgi:hypothetical protein
LIRDHNKFSHTRELDLIASLQPNTTSKHLQETSKLAIEKNQKERTKANGSVANRKPAMSFS